VSNTLLEQVESIESRVSELERELAEVRHHLLSGQDLQVARRASPPVRVAPAPPPRRPAPTPPRAVAPPVTPTAPSGPTIAERLERLDLLGARGLALAGGVVTLLGIVFFFVLAANRGWIGPEARVLMGAAASALVFVAGLVVHHRLGQLYAALAAVGAGVAGGYMTLLAATALYDLVSEPLALLCAAGIAAAGTAVALRWSSELLAGIGLLGALLVPLVPSLQEGPSAVSTAFAAIVFAGAAAVTVVRRWEVLLAVSAAAVAAQTALLAGLGDPGDRGAIAVAVAVALLLLAAGIAWQLGGTATGLVPRLAPLAGSLVLGSGGLALGSLVLLVDGRRAEGWALLLFAVAPAVAGVAVLRRSRDLALVCGTAALAVAGVGTADLLTGATLTVVSSALSSTWPSPPDTSPSSRNRSVRCSSPAPITWPACPVSSRSSALQWSSRSIFRSRCSSGRVFHRSVCARPSSGSVSSRRSLRPPCSSWRPRSGWATSPWSSCGRSPVWPSSPSAAGAATSRSGWPGSVGSH